MPTAYYGTHVPGEKKGLAKAAHISGDWFPAVSQRPRYPQAENLEAPPSISSNFKKNVLYVKST